MGEPGPTPSPSLGVLSLHLDGAPCAVGCPFCYLGARTGLRSLRRPAQAHPDAALLRAVREWDYAELAVALNAGPEGPVRSSERALLAQLVEAARRRDRPVAITATPQLVAAQPSVLDGVQRLNLSVDAWKLPDGPAALLAAVDDAAAIARARGAEVIAIATLSSPRFAEALIDGLLTALVDRPALDGVALNAQKPPPPFCDRAFWLDALARLRPLLDRALDRRLFLDCYVAARLLRLGGCPGRPDLSPCAAGVAFRACVYAAAPDAEGADLDALDEARAAYAPPAVCPFDTRL